MEETATAAAHATLDSRLRRSARFVSGSARRCSAARAGRAHPRPQLGDGLTERLSPSAATGAVDARPEQVEGARRRGLDARVARAEALPFAGEFDAVFSNAVLHWVKDAAGAIGAVHRALRPGGRFVAELGGAGCVAAIRAAIGEALARRGLDAAALDPWFFPTARAYGALLEAGGFDVATIALFPRPTPLPGDVAAWLLTFAQPFLAPLPAGERAAAAAEICEALRRCSSTRPPAGRGLRAAAFRGDGRAA
jgi:SAM-dependent methyltransferase